MNYERELEAAREAAARAGKLILEAYQNFKAIPNARADISTEADRQSQETILEYLHSVFPGDALCAEEATPSLGQSGPGPRTWVVDPIDGSRGFAMKNGEFSVMIGLLEEGRPVIGVVLEPALDRCTWAVQGTGCWAQIGQKEPSSCRVSPVSDLSTARLVQSHTKDPKKPSLAVRALQPARVVETYSAGVKLAMVARGEVELYVNDYPIFHDWDVCAGHVLVLEGGGTVTGLRGEPLRYGLPGHKQDCRLLATNGAVHSAAIVQFTSAQAGPDPAR